MKILMPRARPQRIISGLVAAERPEALLMPVGVQTDQASCRTQGDPRDAELATIHNAFDIVGQQARTATDRAIKEYASQLRETGHLITTTL